MFPGMNSKKMKKAMKRMGIQQDELEGVERVIIEFSDRRFVIDPAEVSEVDMMGKKTYQVMGRAEEKPLDTSDETVEISEDDITAVKEQVDCSDEEARASIEEADGDLTEAIMALQN